MRQKIFLFVDDFAVNAGLISGDKFSAAVVRLPVDKQPQLCQITFAYQCNSYYIVDRSPMVWE